MKKLYYFPIAVLLLVIINYVPVKNFAQNEILSSNVSIQNLQLEKKIYEGGTEVRGSFDIENNSIENASNINYTVNLVGDFADNLNPNYELQTGDPVNNINLKGNEIKKYEFSYVLPTNIPYQDLGFKIRAYSGKTKIDFEIVKFKYDKVQNTNFSTLKEVKIKVADNLIQSGAAFEVDKQFEVGLEYYNKNVINKKDKLKSIISIANVNLPENKIVFSDGKLVETKDSSTSFFHDINTDFLPDGLYEMKAWLVTQNDSQIVSDVYTNQFFKGDTISIGGVSVNKDKISVGQDLKVTFEVNSLNLNRIGSDEKYFVESTLRNSTGQEVGRNNFEIRNIKNQNYESKIKIKNKFDSITLELVIKNSKGEVVISEKDNLNVLYSKNYLAYGLIFFGLLFAFLGLYLVKTKRWKNLVAVVFIFAIFVSLDLFDINFGNLNPPSYVYAYSASSSREIIDSWSPSGTYLSQFINDTRLVRSGNAEEWSVIDYMKKAFSYNSGLGKYGTGYTPSNSISSNTVGYNSYVSPKITVGKISGDNIVGKGEKLSIDFIYTPAPMQLYGAGALDNYRNEKNYKDETVSNLLTYVQYHKYANLVVKGPEYTSDTVYRLGEKIETTYQTTETTWPNRPPVTYFTRDDRGILTTDYGIRNEFTVGIYTILKNENVGPKINSRISLELRDSQTFSNQCDDTTSAPGYSCTAAVKYWGTTGAQSIYLDVREVSNGQCGSANGSVVSSAPTQNLCSSGVAGSVKLATSTSGDTYDWQCFGTNGTNASCSAIKSCEAGYYSCNGSCVLNSQTCYVAGSCGASQSQLLFDKPSTNLCSNGTPTAVTLNNTTNKYNWQCLGSDTAPDASCNADHVVCTDGVDQFGNTCPVCGSATSKNYVYPNEKPLIQELCQMGNYSEPIYDSISKKYIWTCNNDSLTLSRSCTADTQDYFAGICGAGNGMTFEHDETLTDAQMCELGENSNLVTNSGSYSWQCNGNLASETTDDVSCSAARCQLGELECDGNCVAGNSCPPPPNPCAAGSIECDNNCAVNNTCNNVDPDVPSFKISRGKPNGNGGYTEEPGSFIEKGEACILSWEVDGDYCAVYKNAGSVALHAFQIPSPGLNHFGKYTDTDIKQTTDYRIVCISDGFDVHAEKKATCVVNPDSEEF